jgi:hypothetical protein
VWKVTAPSSARARVVFVVLALVTIGAGLAVYLRGTALSPALRDILGDALWAMMITWWIAALMPARRASARAVIALAICWAVEFSQLYHSPGVDHVRATTIGHLVLGSDFDPRDLASYAVGVLAAFVLEMAFRRDGAERR